MSNVQNDVKVVNEWHFVRNCTGKWGVIRSDGKVTVPFEWDMIETFDDDKDASNYLKVRRAGKVGLVDPRDGKFIFEPLYVGIRPAGLNLWNVLPDYEGHTNDKDLGWGVFDESGKCIIKPILEDTIRFSDNGFAMDFELEKNRVWYKNGAEFFKEYEIPKWFGNDVFLLNMDKKSYRNYNAHFNHQDYKLEDDNTWIVKLFPRPRYILVIVNGNFEQGVDAAHASARWGPLMRKGRRSFYYYNHYLGGGGLSAMDFYGNTIDIPESELIKAQNELIELQKNVRHD